MALLTGQEHRSGSVTDSDGRQFVAETGGVGDTQNITGSAAAPTAGAAVATLSGLVVGGVYRVEGVIVLTGTAETALTNLRLQTNGASIPGGGILPSLSGLVVPFLLPRVPCATGGVIRLVALAAATAGSIYTIRLTATRVE